MTIMYPLTVQKDYTELKYSLRSIEKWVIEPYEIVIVGTVVPDWLNNVTWIKVSDVQNKKQLSIRTKILAALELHEEILFMNDDVFLLQPIQPEYYYYGSLKSYSESGSKSLMKQLETMGRTIKHFDGHYPLIYDQRFKEVSKHFTDDCIIKSMYCNYLNIEGVEKPDCKLVKNVAANNIYLFIDRLPCFSTGSYSLHGATPVLEKLFPTPSKFEI